MWWAPHEPHPTTGSWSTLARNFGLPSVPIRTKLVKLGEGHEESLCSSWRSHQEQQWMLRSRRIVRSNLGLGEFREVILEQWRYVLPRSSVAETTTIRLKGWWRECVEPVHCEQIIFSGLVNVWRMTHSVRWTCSCKQAAGDLELRRVDMTRWFVETSRNKSIYVIRLFDG
jgi:hypothetical protein